MDKIITEKIDDKHEDAFWYYGKLIVSCKLPDGTVLTLESDGEIEVAFEEEGGTYLNQEAVDYAVKNNLTDVDLMKFEVTWVNNNWLVVNRWDEDEQVLDELDIVDNYDDGMKLFSEIKEELVSDMNTYLKVAQNDKDEFLKKVATHTDAISELINTLPYKGDTCKESQKMCLLNALYGFEYTINGLEVNDFIK